MNLTCINIYNIFLRSVESSHALLPAIERAKYMGFDAVYFNPFFKTGKSQSIYSVADYYRFDDLSFDGDREPALQIKEFIAACDKNGLRPIVDLVINHTAADSGLLRAHPEFYCYENGAVKIASGRDLNSTILWRDLAQLNYCNHHSGLWDYMLRVCRYYISLGFRGFRCDAADQVPAEFWTWLVQEVKKTDSDIVFIGEAYLCPASTRIGLARAGFDYIYNSAKWWDYQSGWLEEEYNSTCEYISSISFPDSHDTPRLMDETEGDVKRFLQRLYFTAFWSQGFQITMGAEFGISGKLDCVTTRRSHQEAKRYDFTEHIKEALKIRASVFAHHASGEPQRVQYGHGYARIHKGSHGYAMDLHMEQVTVWERLLYECSVYTFNCMDPQPDVWSGPCDASGGGFMDFDST